MGVTQTSKALLKLVYTLHIVNYLFWSKFIAELVGLYVGKSVCDRNQSFTDSIYTNSCDGALAKSWTTDLRAEPLLIVDQFFSETQLRRCSISYSKKLRWQSGAAPRPCIKYFVHKQGCCFARLCPPSWTAAKATSYFYMATLYSLSSVWNSIWDSKIR